VRRLGAGNDSDDCAVGARLFLAGSSAQLADSARFVKRLSSAVDLGGGDQVRGDDDLPEDSAGTAGAGADGTGTEGNVAVAGAAGAGKPLFLGSVVGRRFPYRWIVMALSGFVCMAIIATLSVVYSNTW